jgi:hypothetical protein
VAEEELGELVEEEEEGEVHNRHRARHLLRTLLHHHQRALHQQ